MARPLVTDDLWEIVEPLLPPPRPCRRGGRPPADGRSVLAGIAFVLKTGIRWEHLPQEMGRGCGMTCWRRLRDWHQAGVWRELHRVLLDKLNAAGKIDWSRAVVDSASVRAMHGGKNGPQSSRPAQGGLETPPAGRRQRACGDGVHARRGEPRHDVTQLLPLVDAVPEVRGKRGRPCRRSDRVQGDRGYDSEPHRRQLRARGSRPLLAKRNAAHGSGLGVYRWVVERAESWLHQNRHLKFRYDRRDDIHEAFPAVDCALICLNCLTDPFC
jgi:transposase